MTTPPPARLLPVFLFNGAYIAIAAALSVSRKNGEFIFYIVVMLVLTQLSVGAFAVERAVRETLPESLARVLGNAHAPFALAIGLLALAIGFWPVVAMPIIEALFTGP